ncbi:MAG: pilus (MSHA type) biogenesis protein MshL [Betaproteobacteria bacterium]|nr:pilus (MSHA type) biogenesis protein MshL [Betaproteobacteria bacterium]
MNKALIAVAGCLLLAACGTQPATPSPGHIMAESSPSGSIPKPVQLSAQLLPPKATPKTETYSVVVNKVPVQELLFALARDAKLNVDIHPGIEGSITLNAIDQALPQLLTRIAKQVDMRYELNGPNLAVMPDAPFLRNYKVDYVDISRDTASKVNIATQIATAGGAGTTGTTGGAGGGNNSTTSVTNTSKNHFWQTLVQNVKDILKETDKILPDGSSETTTEQTGSQTTTGTGAPPAAGKNSKTAASIASSPNPAALTSSGTTTVRRTTFQEAASVIFNSEAGLIAVRATNRQHEKIQEFLDQVLNSAKRQVLIEATIAEVQLDDQYQQGINWARLREGGTGFNLSQTASSASSTATGAGLLVLGYANPTSAIGSIAATLRFLESFGKVKVLSSPKISVLNNQTAMLKVVDNSVYFSITSSSTLATVNSPTVSTYTTEIHTVPVGFVMSVTPQIADNDEITLNVRPTISRIIRYVQDPNPALALANPPIVNNVPIIQAREMESILKVTSGQTAVMGGLMQDSVSNFRDEIPGIGKAPLVGNLFSQRNDLITKTELVIFLRPLVVRDASVSGDYKAYRSFLPDENYLKEPNQNTPGLTKEEAVRP